MKNAERINLMLETMGRVLQVLGGLFRNIPYIPAGLVAPLQLQWEKNRMSKPLGYASEFPAFIARVGLHALRTRRFEKKQGQGVFIPMFLRANEAYTMALELGTNENAAPRVNELAYTAESSAYGTGIDLMAKQWEFEGESMLAPCRRFKNSERDLFVGCNLMVVLLGISRNKFIAVDKKFFCLAAATRIAKLMALFSAVEDLLKPEDNDPAASWKEKQQERFSFEEEGFEKTITKWLLNLLGNPEDPRAKGMLSGSSLAEEAEELNPLNPNSFLFTDKKQEADLVFVDSLSAIAKAIVSADIPCWRKLEGILGAYEQTKAEGESLRARRNRRQLVEESESSDDQTAAA